MARMPALDENIARLEDNIKSLTLAASTIKEDLENLKSGGSTDITDISKYFLKLCDNTIEQFNDIKNSLTLCNEENIEYKEEKPEQVVPQDKKSRIRVISIDKLRDPKLKLVQNHQENLKINRPSPRSAADESVIVIDSEDEPIVSLDTTAEDCLVAEPTANPFLFDAFITRPPEHQVPVEELSNNLENPRNVVNSFNDIVPTQDLQKKCRNLVIRIEKNKLIETLQKDGKSRINLKEIKNGCLSRGSKQYQLNRVDSLTSDSMGDRSISTTDDELTNTSVRKRVRSSRKKLRDRMKKSSCSYYELSASETDDSSFNVTPIRKKAKTDGNNSSSKISGKKNSNAGNASIKENGDSRKKNVGKNKNGQRDTSSKKSSQSKSDRKRDKSDSSSDSEQMAAKRRSRKMQQSKKISLVSSDESDKDKKSENSERDKIETDSDSIRDDNNSRKNKKEKKKESSKKSSSSDSDNEEKDDKNNTNDSHKDSSNMAKENTEKLQKKISSDNETDKEAGKKKQKDKTVDTDKENDNHSDGETNASKRDKSLSTDEKEKEDKNDNTDKNSGDENAQAKKKNISERKRREAKEGEKRKDKTDNSDKDANSGEDNNDEGDKDGDNDKDGDSDQDNNDENTKKKDITKRKEGRRDDKGKTQKDQHGNSDKDSERDSDNEDHNDNDKNDGADIDNDDDDQNTQEKDVSKPKGKEDKQEKEKNKNDNTNKDSHNDEDDDENTKKKDASKSKQKEDKAEEQAKNDNKNKDSDTDEDDEENTKKKDASKRKEKENKKEKGKKEKNDKSSQDSDHSAHSDSDNDEDDDENTKRKDALKREKKQDKKEKEKKEKSDQSEKDTEHSANNDSDNDQDDNENTKEKDVSKTKGKEDKNEKEKKEKSDKSSEDSDHSANNDSDNDEDGNDNINRKDVSKKRGNEDKKEKEKKEKNDKSSKGSDNNDDADNNEDADENTKKDVSKGKVKKDKKEKKKKQKKYKSGKDSDDSDDTDNNEDADENTKKKNVSKRKGKEVKKEKEKKQKNYKSGKDSDDNDDTDNDKDTDEKTKKENISKRKGKEVKKEKENKQTNDKSDKDSDDNDDTGNDEDDDNDGENSDDDTDKDNDDDSFEDDDDDYGSKKSKNISKRKRRQAISESDSSSHKKSSNRKRKNARKIKKRNISDDDYDEKEKSNTDNDEDEEEDDKDSPDETNKKTSKRKRIKAVSESESSGSDKDSPNKKRKNIRKIIKKSELDTDTKRAAREEEERKKRIEERQKLYNEFYEKPESIELKKLVLDFDEETKEELLKVDSGLLKHLKPHQATGVKFMWDACFETIKDCETKPGSGCILAHCMGLGKTLQVIALTQALIHNSRKTNVEKVLIITPLSTLSNWKREFHHWLKYCKNKDIEVYDMSNWRENNLRVHKLKEWHEEGGVCIIGYDMYRILANPTSARIRKKMRESLQQSLVDPGPDLVVCDEGHLLKNEKTSLSQAVSKIRTQRRIVLTGTPLQNNLKEYYCMIQFVKPNLLGTYKEYMNRFVNPITNGQYTDSTERDIRLMKNRSHVLHKLLEGCIQRRDYSVLAPYLPPKHEYVIFIKLTDMQRQLYQFYMEKQKPALSEMSSKGAVLFQDFQNLRRIWTHPMSLRVNSEQVMKRKINKDLSDSEGSLKDFIVDETSESSASGSESDSQSSKSTGSNKAEKGVGAKSVRRTRQNADKFCEEDVEEPKLEIPQEWWMSICPEEELNNINHSNKLVLLMQILQDSEAIGDKVLLFSQSLQSLDVIEHFLSLIDTKTSGNDIEGNVNKFTGRWMQGRDYFRLDGSCNVESREQMCKAFNNESNLRARLFLISTRAGGLGINLVAANRVIIFDVSWNPSHDTQSIFRVYRFGQKKPCYIYRFIALGTMEEKVYDRQVAKQATAKRVIDEQQIGRHYNQNDLLELYTFELEPIEPRPIPALPKDRLFADLLAKNDKEIYKYHEHDSLLENEESEILNEEERKAAWAEYEAEKNRPAQIMAYSRQSYGPANGPVTSNKIFGFRTDVLLRLLNMKISQDHPMMTDAQVIQMVPILLQQLYAQMNVGDTSLFNQLLELSASLELPPQGHYINPMAVGFGAGAPMIPYPYMRYQEPQGTTSQNTQNPEYYEIE